MVSVRERTLEFNASFRFNHAVDYAATLGAIASGYAAGWYFGVLDAVALVTIPLFAFVLFAGATISVSLTTTDPEFDG